MRLDQADAQLGPGHGEHGGRGQARQARQANGKRCANRLHLGYRAAGQDAEPLNRIQARLCQAEGACPS